VTEQPGTGHVDLETLAEIDEGVAGTHVEVAAATHLETCAECRARRSQLRTTRALLTALPPEQMPEPVQERVDAALARAADEPSKDVIPFARRGRMWASPAVAGGTAAAAVVVLIGALVAGNVIHRDHSKTNTSSPLSSAAGTNNTAGGVAATRVWSTGANYSATTIPTLVPKLLVGSPPPLSAGALPATASPAPAAPGDSGAVSQKSAQGITQDELRVSPAAVRECGTVLAGGVPTTPVAVDFARFNGKPAAIFVLPAIAHPTLLDVWVVRSICSASSLDLYFQRVARPRTGG
jgi:hypothetical protein